MMTTQKPASMATQLFRLRRVVLAKLGHRFLSSLSAERHFNFINGRRVSPETTSRTLPIVQPSTGRIISQLPLSGTKDVNEAVANSHLAFPGWSRLSGAHRGAVLCRAAQIIRDKVNDIAELEVQDCGKPIWEARFDVQACADAFHYFGGLAQSMCNLGEHHHVNADAFAYVSRDPLGVCGGIGAWNFPFLVASWKVAPALACGNTFVFKPSEHTPLTAVVLAEILTEAGLPDGCFNIVQGNGDTGHQLCVHPQIAKISFTGSVDTGKKVMASCAQGIKKVTLELGGKSPLIIFEDCDLKNAVKGALMANFLSQGQVCSNGTRIYVQKSVANQFVDLFVAATKKLKIGDPLLEDTRVGATIHEAHAIKILKAIDKARIHQGAEVACGGHVVEMKDANLRGGLYLSPCILVNCKDSMSIIQEEVFGAVAGVLTFDTEDEALSRANNTTYGLAAGVFTRDLSRAHRCSRSLDCGTVWINNYNLYPSEIPFGGYKMSGIGRENGLAVIQSYTQTKSVYVELGDVDCPLYTGP